MCWISCDLENLSCSDVSELHWSHEEGKQSASLSVPKAHYQACFELTVTMKINQHFWLQLMQSWIWHLNVCQLLKEPGSLCGFEVFHVKFPSRITLVRCLATFSHVKSTWQLDFCCYSNRWVWYPQVILAWLLPVASVLFFSIIFWSLLSFHMYPWVKTCSCTINKTSTLTGKNTTCLSVI